MDKNAVDYEVAAAVDERDVPDIVFLVAADTARLGVVPRTQRSGRRYTSADAR